MSYHNGTTPAFTTTRRTRVGVTTVFYQPGLQTVPGATAPPVYQAPSAPVAYRIPAGTYLAPATSSPGNVMLPGPVYSPPAAPGQAVTVAPTPGSVANFLSSFVPTGTSTNPAASSPPPGPALTGPVSNPDGSPASSSLVPLVVIALVAWLLLR